MRDGRTLTAPLTDASLEAPDGDGPQPGATIGRFVVTGLLGRGGMGVVLSAYDPMLDRRVAIKLLRPGAFPGVSEHQGKARLQREAQAMAKLAHPNVVAVHDVGAVGEQLFIAMEYVDGQTLSAWASSAVRDWREIVRMFVAAGSGLQAAHAAGMVHRDFKPDNVLIGSDGRPRVGDFGLVSVTRSCEGAGPAEIGTTLHGAIMGTPGYMSPEQVRGEPSDAQSDQFSFCVALYEVLYRQRPFAADDPQRAILSGEVRPPPRKTDVPRWLFEVILRGLRVRREARWPAMGALLEALARDPARRRRRVVGATAAALAVVALAVSARVAQNQRRAMCTGGTARLQGVWDGERRQAVARAFAATRLPFAEATLGKVASALDHYAGAWATMSQEACRATRIDGRQSEQLLDLRTACLDRRRATLGALTAAWSEGVDEQALANAIGATASLPSLDECADARALTERVPLPKEAAAVARIDATRARLDRARALGDSKRMKEARNEAESARRDADATGFLPVQAEAALLLGDLLHRFGELGAIAPLQDAARWAELAHDDRLAAEAVVTLTGAMADGGLAPSAIELAPVAEALVLRAGDPPRLHGELLIWRGSALIAAGKYSEALGALEEAHTRLNHALGASHPATLNAGFKLLLALMKHGDNEGIDALGKQLLAASTESLGADHPQTAEIMDYVGASMWWRGDFVGGRRMLERALAIQENTFGPTSLRTARVVNDLGVLEETQGHLAEAQRHYERVLQIRRRLLAPDNPLVAHALANLSIITRLQGRLGEALEQITTALGIMQRTYGALQSDVAYENELLGEVLADKGDRKGAREHYQRAIDTYAQVAGPRHIDTLWATIVLARFDWRIGNCEEVTRLMIPAVAGMEAVGSESGVASALMPLARCDLQRGAASEALSRLKRALAFYEKRGAALADRGAARFELARALLASGATDARASAVGRQAETELAQAGPLGARDLERVRAWLHRYGR
jgi:tetratricopeptide (TPR) repeat protein